MFSRREVRQLGAMWFLYGLLAILLTGFATDDAVQVKLASRGISRSSYEGPTGIVGALHDACRRAELPTASLWAASPFYLGSTPNPKTALGLLGISQLSLTKTILLVSEGVNVRNFDEVMGEVRDHFDPRFDFVMIPRVPLDTLDFTSRTSRLA